MVSEKETMKTFKTFQLIAFLVSISFVAKSQIKDFDVLSPWSSATLQSNSVLENCQFSMQVEADIAKGCELKIYSSWDNWETEHLSVHDKGLSSSRGWAATYYGKHIPTPTSTGIATFKARCEVIVKDSIIQTEMTEVQTEIGDEWSHDVRINLINPSVNSRVNYEKDTLEFYIVNVGTANFKQGNFITIFILDENAETIGLLTSMYSGPDIAPGDSGRVIKEISYKEEEILSAGQHSLCFEIEIEDLETSTMVDFDLSNNKSCVEFTLVSSVEDRPSARWELFQTDHKLHFTNLTNSTGEFALVDIQGRIQAKGHFEPQAGVNLQKPQKGVYLMNWITPAGKRSQKIWVN